LVAEQVVDSVAVSLPVVALGLAVELLHDHHRLMELVILAVVSVMFAGFCQSNQVLVTAKLLVRTNLMSHRC